MRRRWLLAAPAWLTACSVLPNRPYLQKREWPLDVTRPTTLPPRSGGKTLLVRSLRPAPGLEARGLQVMDGDGSIRTSFYEEWAVPPADAVEDDLRRWLAASGLFKAVLAPGSRASADLALEGELLELLATDAAAAPGQPTTRASLGLTLIDLHPNPARVLLQADVSVAAALPGPDPVQLARSGQEAVRLLLAAAEQRIARVVSP